MALYKVDFFTYNRSARTLTNVHHDMVEDPIIDDDYIAMNASTISIQPTDLVSYGQYIYISGAYKFLGFVTGASTTGGATNVSFKPFIAQFDEDILFNVKYQHRGDMTLENVIYDLLRKYYIYAPDSTSTTYCRDLLQTLPLVVSTTTQTSNWGFNIKPDVEGKNWCKCGFYGTVLTNAMKNYGVALHVKPHFQETTTINGLTYNGYFEIEIGKPTSAGIDQVFNIDADLPGVNVTELQLDEKLSVVNKLMIVNTDDYLLDESIVYYVHPDKTYDTSNSNRITPVVRQLEYVTPEKVEAYDNTKTYDVGDYCTRNGTTYKCKVAITQAENFNSSHWKAVDTDQPFKDAAAEIAYSTLSGLEWNNLIELEVYMTNDLVKPIDLKIGQKVSIRRAEGTYTSMLTGKRYGTEVTLTFGSERIDFTKRR